MHCRIVFIETRPGGLILDALTSRGDVLSADAQVPLSVWGFAAALTLGKWAEQSSQVEAVLYDKRGARRIRLSDDEHVVVLDLSCPATVSSHAEGRMDRSVRRPCLTPPPPDEERLAGG